MTPDFDDLIGDAGTPEERERLREVHDLLVSVDPPPPLTEHGRRAPRIRSLVPRSWAIGALGFAATVAAAAGVAVGHTLGHGNGFQTVFTLPMHGVGQATAASALIEVGKQDASGNRPLQMTVRGLPTPPKEGWYELSLTRKGRPVVPCGIFQTGGSGDAHVTMNAPADLAEYDGWVVTALAGGNQARVLLTT